MKSDTTARRSSFGSIMRRRLSDITNSIPQLKSPSIPEKFASDAGAAKVLVDHLVKEKVALMKLIQEKNKIIDLSGTEIRNLKNCLQKMQLQNWSLAQANSHMSAELNLGKQRLKALQHEIICKEAILKAKNSELKEQEKVNVPKPEFQEEPNKTTQLAEDTKTCKASRRGRPARSQSLGSSTVNHTNIEKEVATSKRRCLRRQSARSKIEHEEPTADKLFEIDEAKFLPPAVPSNSPICDDNSGGEVRRMSLGRPMRRAAEKVQSYRERPVNVKMRRSE
ncbi:SHUGOSHIN 2 [Andrographis paniculata]|uniref:SHUGOSHIN 2 n=1 Tax=Andrographis paniculata TaxID=175694 RepID=UPI0021E7035A|nr:SHUGOSHIN 2 [Andrographis paniculata]